ncbi:MAG: hypothetical protein MUF51_02265, partial [Vicinamibacteria bacterium]|nr:hypothetical protein [Vicinamibacteria bacterium]
MQNKVIVPSLSALLCALCAWSLAEPAALPKQADPIALPNYQRVSPNLAIMGQPTADGWAQLKAWGVRTALNLRTEKEGGQAERQRIESLGLQYIWIPFTAETSSWREVFAIARVLADPRAAPVALH